eukprot:3729802-Amphidinium_carterae.1
MLECDPFSEADSTCVQVILHAVHKTQSLLVCYASGIGLDAFLQGRARDVANPRIHERETQKRTER